MFITPLCEFQHRYTQLMQDSGLMWYINHCKRPEGNKVYSWIRITLGHPGFHSFSHHLPFPSFSSSTVSELQTAKWFKDFVWTLVLRFSPALSGQAGWIHCVWTQRHHAAQHSRSRYVMSDLPQSTDKAQRISVALWIFLCCSLLEQWGSGLSTWENILFLETLSSKAEEKRPS